jgi:hypothetical protein
MARAVRQKPHEHHDPTGGEENASKERAYHGCTRPQNNQGTQWNRELTKGPRQDEEAATQSMAEAVLKGSGGVTGAHEKGEVHRDGEMDGLERKEHSEGHWTHHDVDVLRDEEGRGHTTLDKGRRRGMTGQTSESTSDSMRNDGQSYQLVLPPHELFTSTGPRREGDASSICQMVGAVHGEEHSNPRVKDETV